MELFDQDQALILLRLLVAHVLADFFFQSNSWVEEKKLKGLRASAFYKHIAVVGVVTWVAIWRYPILTAIIALTHFLIDYIKIRLDKKGDISFFIIDQSLHILVIVASWLFIISGWARLVEVTYSLWTSFDFVIILLGYLFCIGPSNYLIQFSTKNLIKKNDDNVKRGGRLIGIFERTIIYTLVLLNQYEAIGFLITGKSILRFADSATKETEYVLVGTMLSYALAILTGAFVNLLLPN